MIYFELVTLTGIVLKEKVFQVSLPTPDGLIAIYKDHAPLVSVTTNGVISVRREPNHPDDMLEQYAINAGGVIEIANDTVRVLVDEADNGKDIDEKQAQAAYDHTKKLAAEAGDEESLEKAMNNLDRETVRLKLAELKRRKKR